MEILRYKPSLNSLCLCGSGLKFKRCCFEASMSFQVVDNKKAWDLIACKDYIGAIKYSRKSIVSYTILHKTNTHPYINQLDKINSSFISIDIDAMSELVYTLMVCYRGLDDTDGFLSALELLRRNIVHYRWQRKITYYQIMASLGDEWPESVGKREVLKLFPIDDEVDLDILQLCIHFWPDKMSLNKMDKIVDKIISIIKSHSQLLQYKILKGVRSLVSSSDEGEAISLIEKAIEEYELTDWVSDDSYGKHMRASALSLLGVLKDSDLLMTSALRAYEDLLCDESWNGQGVSRIYYEAGECCFHLKRYDDAVNYFNKSLDMYDSEYVKMYLATALNEIGGNKAVDIIDSIDASRLERSNYIDYVFHYTRISIRNRDEKMIRKSVEYLKSITNIEPMFERVKSELLLQVVECLDNGVTDVRSKSIMKRLARFAKMLSRYFMIQPNIAGLGVNVNNIIDDVCVTQINKR